MPLFARTVERYSKAEAIVAKMILGLSMTQIIYNLHFLNNEAYISVHYYRCHVVYSKSTGTFPSKFSCDFNIFQRNKFYSIDNFKFIHVIWSCDYDVERRINKNVFFFLLLSLLLFDKSKWF